MLQKRLIRQLTDIVGHQHVLTKESDRLVYDADAYTMKRNTPHAVVLPGTIEELLAVVRVLRQAKQPFLPRGAGTGLSGGAIPPKRGVVVSTTRLNKIIAVDYRNRLALVEAGAINAHISRVAARNGFHFAPDPSSQIASTIGGNIAENAGGPHTLKYGVTVNHVEAIELITPDGDLMWIDAAAPMTEGGYDIPGLLCGSEGTLGIVTRALLNLVPMPSAVRTLLAVFQTVEDATHCVSSIIARGMIPAAMEMMDKEMIQAVEEAFHVGLPLNAAAVLIVELHGLEAGIDDDLQRINTICQQHNSTETRLAADDVEREQLWRARKLAVSALGRLAPNYVTQDGVVPRTKLPHILRHIVRVSKQYGIPIANVMHAGDGNIHPNLLYDERNPEEVERVIQASQAILDECIRLGGTVTGEHGIGVEKIDFMYQLYSDSDLQFMRDVRAALNPDMLMNADKLIPSHRGKSTSESKDVPPLASNS